MKCGSVTSVIAAWEEIDRIPNPLTSTVRNFGWPCYEGAGPHASFKALGLNICQNLYPKRECTPLPTLPTVTASKWWREKPAPPAVRPSREWRSIRGAPIPPRIRVRCSSPTLPVSVFGACSQGRMACPIQRPEPRLWPAPRIPSTCKLGQGATCSMWTSMEGPSDASSTPAAIRPQMLSFRPRHCQGHSPDSHL